MHEIKCDQNETYHFKTCNINETIKITRTFLGILRIEQKARNVYNKIHTKQTKKKTFEAAMISNILGGRKMIPVVEKMEVFPVAGH